MQSCHRVAKKEEDNDSTLLLLPHAGASLFHGPGGNTRQMNALVAARILHVLMLPLLLIWLLRATPRTLSDLKRRWREREAVNSAIGLNCNASEITCP